MVMAHKRTAKKKMDKWKSIVAIVLLLYLLAAALLYLFQDKLVFHPEKLSTAYAFHFPEAFREFNIPLDDTSSLNAVLFKAPAAKGIVLYFHGNTGNINSYAKYVPMLLKEGYDVLMPDYRTYGKSSGALSEQALYDDAYTMYQLACRYFDKDSIVLYGKSLGTCIAASLAAKEPCKALVLECPYYSFDLLAKRYFFLFPVNWLLKYHLPTYRYLQKVSAPVLLIHGQKDQVIPYRQASRLKQVLKPGDQFLTIPEGGHNNLTTFPQYQAALHALLQ